MAAQSVRRMVLPAGGPHEERPARLVAETAWGDRSSACDVAYAQVVGGSDEQVVDE